MFSFSKCDFASFAEHLLINFQFVLVQSMISQARAYFDRFSLFNEHRCGNIWAIILDIQVKTLSANKDKSKFSLNQSKFNDRFTSDRIQIVNIDGGGLQQSKIQAKKCIRNGIKVGLICHGYTLQCLFY